MVDGDLIAEYFFKAVDNLCGQCDFRQEIEYLFAPVERLLHQFDIEAGFATAGDAVQQYR